ncbi:MAG: FecR domain-containing protein, partial [Dehalococcoidia bacterium]|nr:FecR domain-containing protein [Dehalococcoidia bacterium]
MTEYIALAEIVDRCVEEITARRASVEDCLERWPEYRAELEPLLRAVTALASLPGVPEVAPAPERRTAFMAQLALTPQQRPRWRLPRLNLPSLGLGALSMRLAAVVAPAAAIAAFALVLVLARGGTPASAAATLTVFAGGVEQQVLGEWYAAEDGMTLAEGVRLRTGTDGRALLTFPDGSTTTMAPGTELALTRLQANGSRGITIEQLTGRLWHDVVTETDATVSYVVRTPDAVVEARGTVFQTVIEASVGETAVTTIPGLVDVVTTTERVTVAAGEVARAGAQRPAEVRAADVAGTVLVNASVSAALLAPDGAATGSRSDGVVVRQIPGVGTSETDAGRTFSFSDVPEGVYTLWLTPTGDATDTTTPSEVILQTPAGEVHIPLAAASGVASSLRVAVEVTDGRTQIRPRDDTPAPAEATPEVRVVDTERSRNDQDRRKNEVTPTRTATATATPTATPTASPTPTPNERDRDDDDRRDDDRRG